LTGQEQDQVPVVQRQPDIAMLDRVPSKRGLVEGISESESRVPVCVLPDPAARAEEAG